MIQIALKTTNDPTVGVIYFNGIPIIRNLPFTEYVKLVENFEQIRQDWAELLLKNALYQPGDLITDEHESD